MRLVAGRAKSRALDPPDARDSMAGLWRGSRRAAADARASAVPRAGSGTWGPWSVAGCACSARSRRSRIQPVTGAVSARFQGVRAAKPNGARKIFWKFSERVRPPSTVPSARSAEIGTGGVSPGPSTARAGCGMPGPLGCERAEHARPSVPVPVNHRPKNARIYRDGRNNEKQT